MEQKRKWKFARKNRTRLCPECGQPLSKWAEDIMCIPCLEEAVNSVLGGSVPDNDPDLREEDGAEVEDESD